MPSLYKGFSPILGIFLTIWDIDIIRMCNWFWLKWCNYFCCFMFGYEVIHLIVNWLFVCRPHLWPLVLHTNLSLFSSLSLSTPLLSSPLLSSLSPLTPSLPSSSSLLICPQSMAQDWQWLLWTSLSCMVVHLPIFLILGVGLVQRKLWMDSIFSTVTEMWV